MKPDKILLDHGSGGKMSHLLISEMIMPIFDNPVLSKMDDGAILDILGKKVAFSTDSFVVDPLFFPGGNIGDLAVNGTVNDLVVCGASPLCMSVSLIIEEGFPTADLETILQSMSAAAKAVGVQIVTGDTKVVPKGAADKLFINTSGIGWIPEHVEVGADRVKPGDLILLSGAIAEHGMAILTKRQGLKFDAPLFSDTAPLHHIVKRMVMVSRKVHAMRDLTRGGLGTALNEIAEKSGVGMKIYEDKIPVKPEVMGVCELLGFDPLYVANEGKLIAFVAAEGADAVLSAMKRDKLGKDACIIGEVTDDHPKKVYMTTRIGGSRIVDMLTGEQLPRIC